MERSVLEGVLARLWRVLFELMFMMHRPSFKVPASTCLCCWTGAGCSLAQSETLPGHCRYRHYRETLPRMGHCSGVVYRCQLQRVELCIHLAFRLLCAVAG